MVPSHRPTPGMRHPCCYVDCVSGEFSARTVLGCEALVSLTGLSESSSGEAETKEGVPGLVGRLYASIIMNDIGQTYALDLHTDSSARVGHSSRVGKGKRMKNRDGSELWIHQVLRQGLARINKIDGRANPVDILPKVITRDNIT